MTGLVAPSLPPLQVAIDAQVLPSRNGGVAHALMALLRALAALDDGQEAYCLAVATQEEEEFWRPLLGNNQRLASRVEYRRRVSPAWIPPPPSLASRIFRPARPLVRVARRVLNDPPPQVPPRRWPEVHVSDGFYESLGCEVLHHPWQRFVLAAMPTVYNPHDLQHLHFPQFFTREELVQRATDYPAGCRLSQAVAVGSQWIKDDVVAQFGVAPEKVIVIREGAPNQVAPPLAPERIGAVRRQYGLPEEFLLYPAIPWPHKNHLRLVQALRILRDQRQIKAHLVLTGSTWPTAWEQVEREIAEHGLGDQVHRLGFLPEADLRVIQRAATALVQPSLFEASSLPIYDAWMDGVPVACADASALPEQVQDAALLFDPWDVAAMAEAIERILSDQTLRNRLRDRGAARIATFDWSRTARTYRALYRQLAHRPLTDADRSLLAGCGSMAPPAHPPSPRLS